MGQSSCSVRIAEKEARAADRSMGITSALAARACGRTIVVGISPVLATAFR
jgi:hypothetical protein